MADFFSSMCNSALRAAPGRPPGSGDTAGRLGEPRGGRERSPAVPAALATVGPFLSVVGLKRASRLKSKVRNEIEKRHGTSIYNYSSCTCF